MSHRLLKCSKDNLRYHSAHLGRDLLGDWTLVRAWGSLDNARGRITQEVMLIYSAGLTALERTAQRRKRHGYTRFTPAEQA